MKTTRIEFHILQSFPVTCLNRDDIGSPKSAIVGGVPRARVSSQCWKRQVRMSMRDFGIKIGTRTKKIEKLMNGACLSLDAEIKEAQLCADVIAKELSSETLVFISDTECKAFAEYAKSLNFDHTKIKSKELGKISKKVINPAIDALDIALFGRMVAKSSEMDVQAACSFNHAISTHKAVNEIEFFTALDDIRMDGEQGSGHMGSIEFNSATYYRYISLDIGRLAASMNPNDVKTAIEAFTKALFVAVPNARQTTQSGASPWEYAKVLVRKGQGLQVPFEVPVQCENGSYLKPSIDAMNKYLDDKEALFGSIFGKLGCYEWGVDTSYNIDSLINDLKTHVTYNL
ncbi:type I-E CRISPR-associated protein Cas7/Cse4/CasC [Vibrio campbellii]|uniref:type I-E CRISPR-associated protein Cas7/Cse4/CasC n=1 Tax=Vibrio campbellii TaxID=680 RepID=UPI000CD34AF1|nr:type I-E CRISPR-associated protein Cas7/Cse4/CasC [Vibrio campbellii]AUW07377.1 type I-E CRISPR-associated protein Cas7/Cse4/CasC [Vibrio campbellii]